MVIRKTIKTSFDGGAAGWQRVFIRDREILDLVAGDGDVMARRAADNARLPVRVLERSATVLDLQILLHTPQRDAAEDVYVEVIGAGRPAATTFPTFGTTVSAPAEEMDEAMTVYTGEGETGSSVSSNVFVHPYVVRVPVGNWARNLDSNLNGEVTHLIIDTPYPAANGDYENPVIFYSTDNCVTRTRVPSASIPWPLDGNPVTGDNKDVAGFFLPDSGDLIVTWVSNDVSKFARISGDHLTNCAVDSEFEIDGADFRVDSQSAWAKSWLPLGNDEVRCFLASPSPTDTGGSGSLYYRDTESFSNGAAMIWSAPTRVALAGGEYDRGWWHGGIAHDGQGGRFPDGYYYLIYTETLAGAIAGFDTSPVSFARVFRSTSIDGPWEPSLVKLVAGGSGIAVAGVYMASLSFDDAGNTFVVCSGKRDATNFTVGRVAVDLSDTTVSEADAFNAGLGSSSVYDDSSPLKVAMDLEQGLEDVSANAWNVTTEGDAVVTAGTGVVLNGSDQAILVGDAEDLLGGLSYVDMTLVATFPETLTNTETALFGDDTSSGEYALRLRVATSTGQITGAYFHNGSASLGIGTAIGPDLRGGTHVIRALYDVANNQRKFFVDNAAVHSGVAGGALRAANGRQFYIGRSGAASRFTAMTVHYFEMRTGAGPLLTTYRGGFAYPTGAIIPLPQGVLIEVTPGRVGGLTAEQLRGQVHPGDTFVQVGNRLFARIGGDPTFPIDELTVDGTVVRVGASADPALTDSEYYEQNNPTVRRFIDIDNTLYAVTPPA